MSRHQKELMNGHVMWQKRILTLRMNSDMHKLSYRALGTHTNFHTVVLIQVHICSL